MVLGNWPPLLVSKDGLQLFQKRLSTFTCCNRWCSIIPKATIHLYLLQKMVFNYPRNDYPLLLVAKRWCSIIPETTIHLYLLQKMVFNYSRSVQLSQKRLSTFTRCWSSKTMYLEMCYINHSLTFPESSANDGLRLIHFGIIVVVPKSFFTFGHHMHSFLPGHSYLAESTFQITQFAHLLSFYKYSYLAEGALENVTPATI